MLRWPLATVKWRAACAERCTCGSVRRGREIVRLRSVSYSTLDRNALGLFSGSHGLVRKKTYRLGNVIIA
ncbi:hypothetical protein C9J12_22660 [Photobacterium frigidiphilum]|uniref:Uncharacterized protein n=1 Tax=Photobacterium frigidiphilum TaxID=264736 RepID=A0A2T3J9L9_9GAMM|nr:hypothetical protein C9J12_22660 [Photobacterium frigidiphilum]